MKADRQRPPWMEDELVKDIKPEKLDFLNQLFTEGQGRNQKELISFLMPMMRKARQEHLSFTSSEMNAAIAAIRKYSTAEELEKIQRLLSAKPGPQHSAP